MKVLQEHKQANYEEEKREEVEKAEKLENTKRALEKLVHERVLRLRNFWGEEAVDRELKKYRDAGFRIIYLDEMWVTKSTIPSHEYSIKNTPLELDFNQYHNRTIASIAGVS